MRLLFVARRYWPALGGAESFLRDLARELAQRHAVTVLAQRVDDGPATRLSDSLSPPPTFEPFEDGGVRVRPLTLSAARRAALAPLVHQVVPGFRRHAYGRVRVAAAALYARAVAPVIDAGDAAPDVIHMWGGDLIAAAACRAAGQRRIPCVITPFAHTQQYGTGPADVFAYRRADRVVALLETDAAVYRALGVPAARVVVSGVGSPGVPSGGGTALRRDRRIDGPLVVFLGVRRPYKGFRLVLEAAPLVHAARPDVRFAFVGPGPRVAEHDGVIDAGVVDDAERGAWLDAADALCLPSEAEIFPVSFLEAWSVATPVIASDIPTLDELVRRSGGGVVCPRTAPAVAEAVLNLVADSARAAALGRAGHAYWSQHGTIEAAALRHDALYAELTGRTGAECAA
jgi:glycosyltransferase involved in cell wall biosynthesis